MKIVLLKIYNNSLEEIRKIIPYSTGLSIIFGDVKEPNNRKATINSLGKTMLIDMIDCLFGAESKQLYTNVNLKDWSIEADIDYQNTIYNVRFIFNERAEYLVDGKAYTLNEYRDFFSITRNYCDKQILKKAKNSLISPREQPSEPDYRAFLTLLGFDDLSRLTTQVYSLQDQIKQTKQNIQEICKLSGLDYSDKTLAERIFFLDEQTKELENKIDEVSISIESLTTSSITGNFVQEYEEKKAQLKQIKAQIATDKLELKRLEEFIDESTKKDISSNDLLYLFKAANQEIPEMVKKTLYEVEVFHQKVIFDRVESLKKRTLQLFSLIEFNEGESREISSKIDSLGRIISEVSAYKESIKILESYSKELQALKFEQGQLSQIKGMQEKNKSDDISLHKSIEMLGIELEKVEERVQEYRVYVNDLVKKLYPQSVQAFFNINIQTKAIRRNRPISIELSLKGDAGEGVGEVKNNIIDYLIFNYNKYLDVLIQDSNCYNGIDPRQIATMIMQLHNIALDANKQAIIAINKYQLPNRKELIEFVKERAIITLSENEKLLKIDF